MAGYMIGRRRSTSFLVIPSQGSASHPKPPKHRQHYYIRLVSQERRKTWHQAKLYKTDRIGKIGKRGMCPCRLLVCIEAVLLEPRGLKMRLYETGLSELHYRVKRGRQREIEREREIERDVG